MKTAITILLAMALSMAAMVPTSAQPAPSVGRSGHSSSAGPWIVGGIGLGVLSVIARAKVVSDREKRELTSTEATQAIFMPFFWVLSPGPDQVLPFVTQGLESASFQIPSVQGFPLKKNNDTKSR